MKKNQVTMENLAALIKKGSNEVENLTVMVKEGFDGVDEKIDQEINGVKGEINGVKGEIRGINIKLDILGRGLEEVKMRLSNVAYRFELVDLEKRVDVVEGKLGIGKA